MSENNQLQSSCIFPTEPIWGTVSTSISFSGGTPNGPGFEKSFTLKVPAGNIYSISVSADDFVNVSGGGISAESYWDAQNKCIVPGNATSEYTDISESAEDILFSVTYRNNGGPYVLSATVTSIRSGVASARSSSYSTNTSCLLQYTYTLREAFISFFINQLLAQQGLSTPLVFHWEKTTENPDGWTGDAIPPTVIYTEGDLSVRSGVSVDLSSGVATFAVDVFRNGTETDLSVGIQIDTEGRAAVNVTFNF